METTEAESMKDVMDLLETEPSSESDHREQLAILVASGNCKEFQIMCTIGSVHRYIGRYIDRLSTDLSVDISTCPPIYRSIVC